MPEAVPRRERLQVSRTVRVTSTADARRRRERRATHRRLLVPISARFCAAAVPPFRHEARQGEYCISGVYSG